MNGYTLFPIGDERAADAAEQRKMKKILIADDETDIVSMLAGFFEKKGYMVFSARNGAEVFQYVEKQPDIILLDITMPGLDGLEVCERIRGHISCPILFLTARIEDADKVKGFAAGGDDYIVKPFSLIELEARVRAHLRRETRHSFEAQIRFSGELTIDDAVLEAGAIADFPFEKVHIEYV